MVILFGIGLLAGAYSPVDQLVRQERTPPELRGRVFATFMAAFTAVIAPAVLGAGLLLEAVGLRGTLLAFAAGNTAVALYAVAGPAREQVDLER